MKNLFSSKWPHQRTFVPLFVCCLWVAVQWAFPSFHLNAFEKQAAPVITVSPPENSRASLSRRNPAVKTPPPTNTPIRIVHKGVKPPESEMILIPEGPCWIGTNWADTMCGPAHKVSLPSFYIDKYEVTNKMWEQFVKASSVELPSYWSLKEQIPDFEKLPVLNVSWYEASAYAQWCGKRLPTEQEWEKAARGPDGNVFPWGHMYVEPLANTWLTRIGHPTPVGSFPKGVSHYGVHDMLGNALEWTSSPFEPYPRSRFKPSSIVPDAKVLKGVSWKYEPRPLFNRYPAPAYWKRWNQDTLLQRKAPLKGMDLIGIIGFRCARDGKSEI